VDALKAGPNCEEAIRHARQSPADETSKSGNRYFREKAREIKENLSRRQLDRIAAFSVKLEIWKSLAFLGNIGSDSKIPQSRGPMPDRPELKEALTDRPYVRLLLGPRDLGTLREIGCEPEVGRKIHAKPLTSLISRKEKWPRSPLF
jgi:hypothetical protein